MYLMFIQIKSQNVINSLQSLQPKVLGFTMYPYLSLLLSINKKIIKVGIDNDHDAEELKNDYGTEQNGFVSIQDILIKTYHGTNEGH